MECAVEKKESDVRIIRQGVSAVVSLDQFDLPLVTADVPPGLGLVEDLVSHDPGFLSTPVGTEGDPAFTLKT